MPSALIASEPGRYREFGVRPLRRGISLLITVDGRTIDAVSDGPPIEPGQKVRIAEVQGNRVLVHSIDEATPSQTDADPLARPIDSIGGDPFQDSSA